LQGIDIVYNYGTFDFDAPNFYIKFVKGDLQYFVSTSSYQDFIYTYQYYDRDVFEQVLNLTPQQEQKVFNELNDVLSSDRKFYTYKFIDRNCTTMAGDIIELGTGEKLSGKNSDNDKTYRKIIYEYLTDHFIENLGISLTFGAKTDDEMEELFLPAQLLESVENTRLGNNQLAQPTSSVYKSTQANKEVSLWNNYYTFCALILVLIYFSGRKNVYVPILIIGGLMGIFFSIANFYSFHEEITLNYNMLLLNPLYFVLLAFIYKNNVRWITYMVYACMLCIFGYIIIMLAKPHLMLVLPLILLFIAILTRLLFNKRVES
jgi:hypothetical protein